MDLALIIFFRTKKNVIDYFLKFDYLKIITT